MKNHNLISKKIQQGLKDQTHVKVSFIALFFILLAAAGSFARWSYFHRHLGASGGIDLTTAGLPKVAATPDNAALARLSAGFGKLPLSFIENRGQMNGRVAYYVQGQDKSVYFTDQGLTLVLNDQRLEGEAEPSTPTLRPASFNPAVLMDEGSRPGRWALKLDFVGARSGVRPQGLSMAPGVVSYLKGDRSRWQSGLKTYQSIIYRDLWPGIDLIYSGTVSRMKYSFVVRPGADPNQIKLAYQGATAIKVGDSGSLEVSTPAGGFSDEQPVSYQEASGEPVSVTTAYKLEARSERGAQVYGFQLGEYDKSRELVIDPAVLIYCGFIGGNNDDTKVNGIAVDSDGSAYVTGNTNSNNSSFPDGDGFGALPGMDRNYNGGNYDAFVVKINPAGTALIYATYIGGSDDDRVHGIAVDGAGNAYITGSTLSNQLSFPVGPVGPDLTNNGGVDAYVAKINAAGTALDYCGYIGGSGYEEALGIAVDGAGHAFVTGYTNSNQLSFPVGPVGPDLTYNGGNYDAFVAKVNSSGAGLDYCGYIGGSDKDTGYGIAVDNTGNAYVTGDTWSANSSFPDGDGIGVLPGPNRNHSGENDAFVTKVNVAGTGLIYAGYIGGIGQDVGRSIAVDNTGHTYITGYTSSDHLSFPVGPVGPDLTYNGGFGDGFVAKVNAAGTGLDYCGYIGSNSQDLAYGIAIDGAGHAYVTGSTFMPGQSFPDGDGFGDIPGPDQTFNGYKDAFVARINAAGTGLDYCGYIGGTGEDIGSSIAVDSSGNVYVAGNTHIGSLNFPDGDGFGSLPGVGHSISGSSTVVGFIAKIQGVSPKILSLSPTVGTAGSPGFTLTVAGENFFPGAVVRWNGVNRPTNRLSSTQLEAQISAADVATPGGASVTVLSSGEISNALTFNVCATPFISSINPTQVTADGPGFTLTVNGTNFGAKSVVVWNGNTRKTTFISSTQLKAEITAADIAIPPNVPSMSIPITVFSAGTCGGYSNERFLTITRISDQ